MSSDVQKYLTSLDVQQWPDMARQKMDEKKRNNSIVERNIRTMRELLKAFVSYSTRQWIGPMLAAVNENYNNLCAKPEVEL